MILQVCLLVHNMLLTRSIPTVFQYLTPYAFILIRTKTCDLTVNIKVAENKNQYHQFI